MRPVHLVVRTLQEALQHSKLAQDLHRRRVNRVAPEIAEEIRVLFEHAHAAACSGEEQSRHHSGRTATGDDDIRVLFRRHDGNALTAVVPSSQRPGHASA